MTDQQTKQRILVAATDLFADKGFKKTTVREICQAARANVAAVHYHFGDKGGLYEAALSYALEIQPLVSYPDGSTGAEKLKLWIDHTIGNCLGHPPAHMSRLMTLEMKEPSPYFRVLAETMIAPKMDDLQRCIEEIVVHPLPQDRLMMLAVSIVSQILIFDHSKSAVSLFMPDFDYGPQSLRKLSDHVLNVSLGMLENLKAELSQ